MTQLNSIPILNPRHRICLRCRFNWLLPPDESPAFRPATCPNCTSKIWDTPRTNLYDAGRRAGARSERKKLIKAGILPKSPPPIEDDPLDGIISDFAPDPSKPVYRKTLVKRSPRPRPRTFTLPSPLPPSTESLSLHGRTWSYIAPSLEARHITRWLKERATVIFLASGRPHRVTEAIETLSSGYVLKARRQTNLLIPRLKDIIIVVFHKERTPDEPCINVGQSAN